MSDTGQVTASEAPVDGRTARAHRTRDAIVNALVELVDRGHYRPTAPVIAEEAGVSVRSVFQHFDDLDQLHLAVAVRSVERLAGLVLPIDPELAFDERVRSMVRQRAHLFEAITPIRRAALMHEPSSDAVGTWLDEGHAFLRGEVAKTFGPELAQLGDRQTPVLDALDIALSWPTWDTLRRRVGRSEAEAATSLDAAVRTLLSPAGPA